MKSLFRSSLVLLSTAIASVSGVAISSSPAQSQVTSVYQLQLVARPNGSGPYCVDIDVSKIGINQGANNAKVSPCRNIQEQRFLVRGVGNGLFQFAVQSKPNQCLTVDGTKVGIINGAANTHTEQCRNIQEINHSLSDFGNGTYGLVLQARAIVDC